MHVFKDDTLDGYFSISRINERTNNSAFEIDNYTIIFNYGHPITFTKDEVQLDLIMDSIHFFTPKDRLLKIDFKDDEHFILEFNRDFYCVQLHDKEISCNGLLFNHSIIPPAIHLNDDQIKEFELVFSSIVKEFKVEDSIQRDMLQLLLKRLLIISARIVRDELKSKKGINTEQSDIIRKYNTLVEQHFKTKHKVSDYAEMVHRSPKTLSNLFKKYIDQSPLFIIHNRILLEAKRLLIYSNLTVKEIGYELGFADSSQFNRFFKKHVMVTASTFRKKSQENNTPKE